MAQFEKDVSIIKKAHNVQYNKCKFIDTFLIPNLELASATKLSHTFASMETKKWVFIAQQKIARKSKCLISLMMDTFKKSENLKTALVVLEKEDLLCQKAWQAFYSQFNENKEANKLICLYYNTKLISVTFFSLKQLFFGLGIQDN